MVVYVKRCEVCDRVLSSFNTFKLQLQSLFIMRLDYCWLLDFAKLLVTTPNGAKYVLVMVEHFSTWTKFVALSQSSIELTAVAFLDRVLDILGHHLRY